MAFAGVASASVLETASGGAISYQFDAWTYHDAPDTCLDAAAAVHDFPVGIGANALNANVTTAMLVPGEDESDLLFLHVPSGLVGTRISTSVVPADTGYALVAQVLAPACDGTIFDTQNLPVEPTDPLPGVGQLQAAADLVSAQACSNGGWRFSLTGLHDAPATVHAAWTDGTQTDVPADSNGNGQTSFYSTSDGGNYTLDRVTANLPANWTGSFSVVDSPCGLTDGGAVFGLPPTQSGNSFEFTPTHNGTYYVSVLLLGHGVGSDPVPHSIPLTCHFCFGAPLKPGVQPDQYKVRTYFV